jgi:hypothetical protein
MRRLDVLHYAMNAEIGVPMVVGVDEDDVGTLLRSEWRMQNDERKAARRFMLCCVKRRSRAKISANACRIR